MLARIQTCTLAGVDAIPVSVEIFMRYGQLPGISTVGLPDTAVRESKDRVFAALMTSGYSLPLQRITVNLAPANLRKEGSSYDLPIAVGLLKAMGAVEDRFLADTVFVGELSLDGKVRSVRGVLPIAANAAKYGWKRIILPAANAREAAIVENLEVLPVENLAQAVEFLNGSSEISPFKNALHFTFEATQSANVEMSDIKGQEHAKRALEVAAAGGHNMLMIGPPGSGKTMIARRIPTILPALTIEEALEITKIHSVSGILDAEQGLVTSRPFRAPHHSISDAGLIGGGSYPMPGEVSLSHNGVLFLDELPEFKRHVLEVMRQPLEDGQVTIARAQTSLTYPAGFMLIAAMNPCPCGWKSHPEHMCRCSPVQIDHYLNKISGPLLDRIDIHIEVASVQFRELTQTRTGESSAEIRKRVEQARQIQIQRFNTPSNPSRQSSCYTRQTFNRRIHCNAHMGPRELRRHCRLDETSYQLIEQAMKKLGLSARAYDRILKVSRTIADLDGSEAIQTHHLAEAIQYRALDRSNWNTPTFP
jgi:magnesium chelatase family protein